MKARYTKGACAWLGASVVLTSSSLFAAPPLLPLTKVRLYETGVAYFERKGSLQNSAELKVPTGHLDDALKTLVVLGDDAAEVSGLRFESRVSRSMGQALAGLPAESNEPIGYTELLQSLRGAEVTINAGSGRYIGRILEIVPADKSDDSECIAPLAENSEGTASCQLKRFENVLLLTQEGALRRMRSEEITSIQPRDPNHTARLRAAVNAMSPRGARSTQSLRIVGRSRGPVTLGYVAETPVWRTSYRLVLDPNGEARLQGWGLIHNDTEEDWQGVQIELVNGQPDSFLFPLAAPRYAHRELVTPPQPLPNVPQLLDTTVDNLWMGTGHGLGLSGFGEGGGGQGFGAGYGRLAGSHKSRGPRISELLRMGQLAGTDPAAGIETNALFLYRLPATTELPARSSALLPFLDQAVDGNHMVWVDGQAPARSAIRVRNTTAQTLPSGTIAVFESGGFAGESLLGRLKPGETALVEYGVDLDVEVQTRTDARIEEPQVVHYREGMLEEHYVRQSTLSTSVRNRSQASRRVCLAISAAKNVEITGGEQVGYEERAGKPYVVLEVPAGKVQERSLRVREGLVRNHSTITAALLTRLSQATALSKRAPQLKKAARLLTQAKNREAAATRWKAGLDTLKENLARLREHGAKLKGTRAAETLGERILARERNLEALQAKIARLNANAQTDRREAHKLLKKM